MSDSEAATKSEQEVVDDQPEDVVVNDEAEETPNGTDAAEGETEETKEETQETEEAVNGDEETPEETAEETPEDAPEETPEGEANEETPAEDATEETPEETPAEDAAEETEETPEETKEEEAPAEETPEETPAEEATEETEETPEETTEEEAPAEEAAEETEETPEETKDEEETPEEEAPEEEGDAGEEEKAEDEEQDEGDEAASDAPTAPVEDDPEEDAVANGDAEPIRYTDMSTTAEFNDPDRLKEVLAAVRSDGGDVNRKAWVIVGHVDNQPNVIDVVDSDTSDEATLDDMLAKLQDDQVMYGLLRMTTSVDMSTTVKFVYIHWIGEKVAFAKRGRFGVVHGSVIEHFNPFHVMLETGTMDDLSDEALTAKLEEGSGTKNHVLDWAEANSRQQRGFTQHQVRRNDTRQAKIAAPEGANVDINDDLKEAIAEVRQDSSETMYVVGGFEGGNIKAPLSLVAKGSGGLDEIKEALLDDQPQLGENTKPITKGKVSAYAGPIEKVFSPVHVSLSFSNRYDMEEDIIKDKVMAGSGSKRNVKD